MDRSLHLLQILEMEVLVEEITEPPDQPSIHFVEVVLGDRVPDFGEFQFVVNETLQYPDDSSIENVERLRSHGLHFVELAGKRKEALVREGCKPLTCWRTPKRRILQGGRESRCPGLGVGIC